MALHRLLLLAGALAFSFASAQAAIAPCTSARDCSLLGECVVGACMCDVGWAGVDCGGADLLPFNASAGQGYVNASAASWGGIPMPDSEVAGRWVLLVSEMALGCPLQLFQNNSYIVRAISETGPGGPFRHLDTVLPPLSFSVQAIGPTADGYYVFYFLGAPNLGAVIDCAAHGVPPGYVHPYPPSMFVLSLAWSRSLAGPWATRTLFGANASASPSGGGGWDCGKTNPSPTLLANGTVILAFRSVACSGGSPGEYLGLASAPHWNATTYDTLALPVVAPTDGTGSHEDPFLWEDARGNLHIISHNQGRGNVCNRSSQACGAHLFSGDGGNSWDVSATPAYDLLLLANGTRMLPATRQRPGLVLDPVSRAPLWLFNGMALVGTGNGDLTQLTHTHAMQFAGAGESGQVPAAA